MTVAIIGCGRVGSQWDEGAASDRPALTHAAAFQRADGARLAALCDSNPARLQAAACARGVDRTYTSPAALFEALKPDIAVIATPTATRREPIERAIAAGVRTIVCEKPLAHTFDEGEVLARCLRQADTRVFVNYLRRWDVAMGRWRARITRGEIGTIRRVAGWYGKGLLNNASHLVDLVAFVTGAVPVRARALARRCAPEEAQWSGGTDPTIDAELVFAGESEFVLTLIGTDHRYATVFELDVLGSKGRLRLSDGGLRLEAWSSGADPIMPDYRVLVPVEPDRPGLQHAMERLAADAVSTVLGDPAEPACTVLDALASLAGIDAIVRSDREDSAWQAVMRTTLCS